MSDLIDHYIALLKTYNEHTNIYSKKAYDKLDFHIQDCITLANLIGNQPISVVDFGSGSGFPSIILAISNPNNQVVAVESKSRKAIFLLQVVEVLNLSNITIINQNLYEWVRTVKKPFDVVTAKAFGSIDKIKGIAKHIVKKGQSKVFVPISYDQSLLFDGQFVINKAPYYYYSDMV